jgi:capsule biosynthesis phosphatase
MRICLDLDGVICELRKPGETYADLQPVPGAAEKLRQLKEAGHTIIIHTGRHMKTCEGNVGLVLARQGYITLEWLARNNIPFDEIYFGKPWADVYIDDNAYRFTSWDDISSDGTSLPMQHEKLLAQSCSDGHHTMPEDTKPELPHEVTVGKGEQLLSAD